MQPIQPQDPLYAAITKLDPYVEPLKLLGGGLAAIGLTIAFYMYITPFEEGVAHGQASAWWPIAMLYNFAGKWPIVGIGVAGGLIAAIFGARNVLRVRREVAARPAPAAPVA